MPIKVSYETDLAIEDIAPLWQDLAERAKPSFFLSWHWVACWLRESGLRPVLLTAKRNGVLIGLALLHRPAGRRPALLPALHLTSAGGGDRDSVFIEYNGFLASAADAAAVETAFVGFLLERPRFRRIDGGWATLTLPGVGDSIRTRLAETCLSIHAVASRPSPFIDLAAIRRSGRTYLDTRSSNCRQQIRRSIRLFEAAGGLHSQSATSVGEALATLDRLKLLHQRRWQARNQPGAFASPFFERFHRRLVCEAWPGGHVDLVALRLGDETVGCLYNFIHEGIA